MHFYIDFFLENIIFFEVWIFVNKLKINLFCAILTYFFKKLISRKFPRLKVTQIEFNSAKLLRCFFFLFKVKDNGKLFTVHFSNFWNSKIVYAFENGKILKTLKRLIVAQFRKSFVFSELENYHFTKPLKVASFSKIAGDMGNIL